MRSSLVFRREVRQSTRQTNTDSQFDKSPMIETSFTLAADCRPFSKGKPSCRKHGEGSIFKRTDDGPYFISWYDAAGKRKAHCTKTTDKTTAQRILAKKLADVALRRDGVIDARQESVVIESAKPIETHLADFESMM